VPSRLRRSDPGSPGIRRRRRGKGFELVGPGGARVADLAVVTRVNELRIPPAWNEVWICPDDRGHIQATGIDAAGRRQYLYHPRWHEQRARAKFRSMELFAAALPELRARVEADLGTSGEPSYDRVLAAMVRLLDRGFFRIGCEEYAERNETYGIATLHKAHVTVLEGHALYFDFPAKHGRRALRHVVDPLTAELIAQLKRRRGGGHELFAYRERPRGPWRDVKSAEVNAYLKDRTGLEVSAKDFRTWNATVLAAVAIAVAADAPTKTARRRALVRAVKEVSHYLGNTPAVARASYIDPRVFDRFQAGATIRPVLHDLGGLPDPGDPATQGVIEAAVLDLLGGDGQAFREAA
jgi:DNA topoisomerase IB